MISTFLAEDHSKHIMDSVKAPCSLDKMLDETCNLIVCLNHVLSNILHRQFSKHVELRTEIALDVPECIENDYTKVKQILNNLLSNAIKFTSEGSVTIRADITILACSAFATKDFQERAYQVGCEGYITKPIEPDRLVQQVEKLVLSSKIRKRVAEHKKN